MHFNRQSFTSIVSCKSFNQKFLQISFFKTSTCFGWILWLASPSSLLSPTSLLRSLSLKEGKIPQVRTFPQHGDVKVCCFFIPWCVVHVKCALFCVHESNQPLQFKKTTNTKKVTLKAAQRGKEEKKRGSTRPPTTAWLLT